MSSLYLGGDATNPSQLDQYDEGETVGDVDESSRLLVTRSALETALCALEGLLALMHAHTNSPDTPVAKMMQRLRIVVPYAALEQCIEQLKALSCGLLRFLMVLDGSEPTKDCIRTIANAGIFPQFEQGQLALRCLLGCVRVAVTAGPQQEVAAQTRVYEMLGPAYRLASHMKKSRASTQAGVSSTTMTAGVTGHEQVRGIKNILKGFTSLFSRFMSADTDADATTYDAKEKRQFATANERINILLALFVELIRSADPDVRQDTSSKLLQLCADRVQPASPSFAEKMMTFVVTAVPDGATARLEAAVKASARVMECVAKCSEMEEEDAMSEVESEEGGVAIVKQRRDIKTHAGYFLCQSNLPAAVNALAGIFERATSDAEFLHRLRDQRFRSAAMKKRADQLLQRVESRDMDPNDGGGEADEDNADIRRRHLWEDEEERAMLARDVVDATLHGMVRMILQGVCQMLTMYAGASCERVLALLVKIFRLQVRLAKDQISFVGDMVPMSFQRMFEQSSESIALVRSLINEMQAKDLEAAAVGGGRAGSPDAQQQEGKIGVGGKRKKAQAAGRQARIVPELVYQLEQLDVQLIAIAARDKQAKCSVAGLLLPSTLRDFKLQYNGDSSPSQKRAK
jgi:hypothetical protein